MTKWTIEMSKDFADAYGILSFQVLTDSSERREAVSKAIAILSYEFNLPLPEEQILTIKRA